MSRDVAAYFENTVIPLIEKIFPELASEVSIQVHGSYGLGIADERSDLDAVLYLDDPLWKSRGGQLQLLLDHMPEKFTTTTHDHPEICVWPHSWLGDRRAFLEGSGDPPWEKVPVEELFEIQENLVVRDPHAIFQRLRLATAAEKLPERLWNKRLITTLTELKDDFIEIAQVTERARLMESHIVLAGILQKLLYTGFYAGRRYYPWRTHLWWAFEKLPGDAFGLKPALSEAIAAATWKQRLEHIKSAHRTCKDRLAAQGIVTRAVMDDLVWAHRLQAWDKPDWRDRLTLCERKSEACGYARSDGWVWSLWDWL